MSHSIIPINAQVRESFQTELADASNDPGLQPLLSGHSAELLPCFARYHAHLTRLPRRVRRKLQRQWQRSLSALALLLALGQVPALAAKIPVNGSTCTLIDAISAANTDLAVGGCRAGSGADILKLVPKSTHTLIKVNNIETDYYGGQLKNGLPVIVSDITIEGHGSTIRSNANAPEFNLFSVHPPGDLTLKGTKVSGGKNVGFYVYSGGSSLTLANSTVSGNHVGIQMHLGGSTTLINSAVSGNHGAGVRMEIGGLTMTNSTISGNHGDGVSIDYGGVTMTNSTVSGNHGDGVEAIAGFNVSLSNSTVSGNADAGINANAFFDGTSVTLVNSSITGNSTGINVEDTSLSVKRTLVAGNADTEIYSVGAKIIADNFNLFGHDDLTNARAFVGFVPSASDITATSDGTKPTALGKILNSKLTRSGGRTRTHNLVKGSPAVDAVPTGCPPPTTDQRGVPRPQGSRCDIGAVELVLCNNQATTFVGTKANDVIKGTSGRDIIHGLGGNDRIFGLGGNDVICGGAGRDTLNGGGGTDRCDGGSGTDKSFNCEAVANVP